MLASDFGQKTDESLLKNLERIVRLFWSALAVREPPTGRIRRLSVIIVPEIGLEKARCKVRGTACRYEPTFLVSRFRWRRISGMRGSLGDQDD